MIDIKKDLQNVYDSIAKDFSNTRYVPWQELSIFIPYLPEGGKVLDLGCGNGRLLKVLQSANKKFEYLGVDFSAKLLEQARQQFSGYTFQEADMAKVDFPPDSFDVVCLVASLHHLDKQKEREELLNKIYTWLKPGGILFMTNWNLLQPKYVEYIIKNISHKKTWNDFFIPYTSPDRQSTHWRYYHHFTKSELKNLLLGAGFQMEPLGIYKTKYNLNCLVKK